jgi:hypothetical protein
VTAGCGHSCPLWSRCGKRAAGIVPDRREVDGERSQCLLHVDGVPLGIPAHQTGERRLHGIGGRFLLLCQRLLRDMLHLEMPSAQLFKDLHNLELAEGLGAAYLERGIARSRIVQARYGKLRDVREGD